MKRIATIVLSAVSMFGVVFAQTPNSPPKPAQQNKPEDVLRITTQLVQTDVVVTDKNDQIVPDLKLEDFELYEKGRKQNLQFMEFVSSDLNVPGRTEGLTGSAKVNPGGEDSASRYLTRENVKRVIAFVVDDVTIPSEDMARVRAMLSDFVDHKMSDGDLVAIVRTVGSTGLLEQFTSDREILRRAVSQIGARSVPPYAAFTGPEPGRLIKLPSPTGMPDTREQIGDMEIDSGSSLLLEGADEATNQVPKAFLALGVSKVLVDSLREIPGRKNLVLLSGGLPMFDLTRDGRFGGDISQLFQELTDNATRSGVVINTMDVRGLTTAGAVAKFVDTPAKSALGGGTLAGMDENVSFGRAADTSLLGAKPLSLTQQLTLRTLAGQTGGISVVNTNNFGDGLNRILSRSRAYYRLAYRPSEPFDNKFHKVEIKVRRSGLRTYAAEGYYAREEKSAGSLTKEEEIIKAATSPLAKRDLDMAAELQYRFLPTNQAQLDINTFIDARKLLFTKSDDGKHRASFDIAGFVFDQVGKNRGGISQTVNAELSDEEYQRALTNGISYTASTQAAPGYYQVRLVVREVSTGKIGSVSKYFEVPDLSNKQLMMSSVMLYQVNSSGADKNPQQLAPTRVISRKNDLRYAVVVYNPKLERDKPQAKSQLIISQGGRMLFKEPEQPVQTPGSAAGQFIKLGQVGLSKVASGRYVLTLVVTDPLADKKRQIVSRSVDFTVVD
jgi:VWFA-related protein